MNNQWPPMAQGNGKSSNRFVNPPAADSAENPIWVLGEQQEISWVTTLTAFNVSMWQQSISQRSGANMGNIFSQVHNTGVTNFTWTVHTYGFSLEDSPIFFFWINTNTPEGFTSNYFNITEKARITSASTFYTATSIFEPKSTTSPNSSSASTTPSLPTETSPASASEPGLDSTAKIALGVGVGVGVPAVLLLGALTCLKYCQSQSGKSKTPTVHPEFATIPPRNQAPPSPPKEVAGSQVPEWYPELPDRPY
ncbi:uncharacterized protein BDW43DRAFT_303158 [Aspergillus alliaceus]|uniref:uncharacterized protein n=1 Tax=Petromyces alliaceus TaxID=209559 RepID=UPI0012A71661|nr:uncharacterized protein BDW43DRAFT_303158 [Aspergillus alliaceus]KAB8229415.1 hypothetical protein BDW43DRAFT_303158 [Aspergillus alliaceus]